MSSPSTKSASRRSAKQVLSEAELARIAGELAEGKPPMVWFTAAAVGVAEGKSGKVVALGDPSDGDFLQVKPTGSKDVLSFGPSEVTLTKPARATTVAPGGSSRTRPESVPEPSNRKDTTVTQPSTLPSTAPTPPAPRPLAPVPDESAAAPKPATPRPAKAPAARKPKAPEVTVTLTGSADGEWIVDVVNGKKRSVKGLAVSSGAVAQAAKILHPEVEEVVAGILEAARGAQQAKVAQLQAELEAAKRLLAELN
ncbi:DUF6319 family protein [Nocardia rhizosphaerihabitans]|uniref:Cell wall anchor protein n=1 Tax=Nocardia rhizosphaerihabitans TaxID=1691570 RepID=A0ABQ2K9R7_9NOCA|nr:DUF6319 family protein [Nocardia rhizosphaerihabitans]GGN77095.1 hypothetical protein GCM10011610_23220 [Nocardia rhizosphaerihabitans]